MRESEKEPEQIEKHYPLERFSSEEEHRAALARLEEFLRTLKSWEAAAGNLNLKPPSVN